VIISKREMRMDMLQKYISYASEDLVEDSFFWKWVLEEGQGEDSFGQKFIKCYPYKADIIERAREIVLQLNAGKYQLSNEKVASVWTRIQQSKSNATTLELESACHD
jgi:DNA mismatch repair ATPase MutS